MAVELPPGLRARGPAGATPARRPGSVRRTASIDMRWPGGRGTRMHLLGRSRDLLTPSDGGPPRVLAEDELRVGVALDRAIEDIEATPPRPSIGALVGARGGGGYRNALDEAMPEERAAGTPLYLLLDDFAGATLISGFAYSQWMTEWAAPVVGQPAPRRRMEGICIGFQPGSSALSRDGGVNHTQQVMPVPPLERPDDPLSWHRLEHITEVSTRRARRIDVRVGEVIEIESMFQDSTTVPAGGRVAVHEYRLEATADPSTGALLSVHADPRVLPYRECPLAATNVQRLVGTPLPELRRVVLDELRGVHGCTHLNDALRALAEVPVLVRSLL
ncbi:DUF2889 domain-containing protein [Streptosporangium sp. NPDC002544]|uniref:DUF2889 domain-containing protein n=1 Tax=Streptosporangium sp. NPDC002544 TaxID=3154538 RepID=UPI003333F1CA